MEVPAGRSPILQGDSPASVWSRLSTTMRLDALLTSVAASLLQMCLCTTSTAAATYRGREATATCPCITSAPQGILTSTSDREDHFQGTTSHQAPTSTGVSRAPGSRYMTSRPENFSTTP